MPKPRKLPQGTRQKKPTHPHHARHVSGVLTSKQDVADRANLAKARAVLATLPRTAAQQQASVVNLVAARAHKHAPSAAQLRVEQTWAAAGKAAWARGAQLWIARGRAAWLRHRNTGGSIRLHSLKASVGRRHPIGTHIEPAPIKRSFTRPHLLYQPHRFYREISSTSNASAATITQWHRARHHRFRKHIYERKMRRHYIGHWRRTRRRIHPY